MVRYLEAFGKSFSVPDPDCVASLAAEYRGICASIEDAESQLKALGSPQEWAQWTGGAAEKFSQSLGVLPHQLGQAWQSYSMVASALSDYASEMRPLVAAICSLVIQADDVQGTLQATQTARSQVMQAGQDPQSTGWNLRLQEARAAAGNTQHALSSQLAELDKISASCVGQIHQAQHEGIQNSVINDFKRYVVMDGGHIAGVGIKVIRGAADVLDVLFIKPITSALGSVAGFLNDPSFKTFGEALEGLTGVLAILAFVPGVDAFAFPAMLILGGMALASDSVAAEKHEESWGKVALTAVSFGTMAVGGVLSRGFSSGEDLLDGAFSRSDAGETVRLLEGTDARTSASALWNNGIRRVFSRDEFKGGLADLTKASKDAKAAVLDWHGTLNAAPGKALAGVKEFVHAGDDGYSHSPAAVTFRHLKFAADRVGNASDYAKDKLFPEGAPACP